MVPSSEHNYVQRELVNWAPWSLVRTVGTPNRDTQVWRKALASFGLEMSGNGAASGHLVVLSTIVSR